MLNAYYTWRRLLTLLIGNTGEGPYRALHRRWLPSSSLISAASTSYGPEYAEGAPFLSPNSLILHLIRFTSIDTRFGHCALPPK